MKRNSDPKLTHHKDAARPWMVVVPASHFGKRIRKTFTKEQDARQFLQETVAKISSRVTVRTTQEEVLLIASYRDKFMLREIDDILAEAWQRKQRADLTLAELCGLYLGEQEERYRRRYIGELHMTDIQRRIPKLLASPLAPRSIHELNRRDIQDWLETLTGAARNRRNLFRHLQAALNYAVREGLLEQSPAAGVDLPSLASPTQILQPDQLRGLFAAALELKEESTYWWLFFGAFAGLRTSEVERLCWEDIHPASGDLYVRPPGKTKNAERWVRFTPPLLAFDWAGKPDEGLVLGGFCERFRQPRREKVYVRAGHRVPHNALRHSYASHHLVEYGEPFKTAAEMGHATPRQTFDSYRAAVKESQAHDYWSIVTQWDFGTEFERTIKPPKGETK